MSLAFSLDQAGQGCAALESLVLAAQSGHASAQLQLAIWLLAGHNTEPSPRAGFALVQSLALVGDGFAQGFCASLAAGGLGTDQSWSRAVDWLLLAAQSGWPPALCQLALGCPRGSSERSSLLQQGVSWGDPIAEQVLQGQPSCVPPLKEINWKRLPGLFKAAVAEDLPEPQWLDKTIGLRCFPAAIDPDLCLYLCATAAPFLRPARVNDAGNGDSIDASRNNDAMGFHPLESDLVSHLVRWKMAKAAGSGADFAEVLSVLRYRPGQRYQPHYDFFDPAYSSHQQALASRGQRQSTVLLYLNQGYQGGQTRFCQRQRRFRGQLGDLLVFDNVNPDGSVNRSTLHESEVLTQGEKWLASLWIRQRPPV